MGRLTTRGPGSATDDDERVRGKLYMDERDGENTTRRVYDFDRWPCRWQWSACRYGNGLFGFWICLQPGRKCYSVLLGVWLIIYEYDIDRRTLKNCASQEYEW